MVDIGRDNVVVIFAIRRRVPAIRRLIQTTTEIGARVGLITDPGLVNVTGAQWVIRCQTKTREPIDDHASAIAVAHVLTEQVIVQLQGESSRRLGDIDDLHDSPDELE